MVADIKITANTVDIVKYLERTKQKIPNQIQMALAKASQFGIMRITDKTQKGQLPDGGRFRPYKKSTRKSRTKRKRQVGHVDLTDTGKMFRSLDFKQSGFKNTLFFSNIERAKIAAQHDFFGVGKRKTKRPFFSIGNDEEEKLKNEFAKFYFSAVGI